MQEEFVDLCKTILSDFKFIDLIVNFCIEPKDSEVQLGPKETTYSTYISLDRVNQLHDIINWMPMLFKIDKNNSSKMEMAINVDKQNEQKAEVRKKYDKKISGPVLDKSDPYLNKLVELIYNNIKSRFQVFGNSFCYLDFKNRQGVSFQDFSRGLDGFGIKLHPSD